MSCIFFTTTCARTLKNAPYIHIYLRRVTKSVPIIIQPRFCLPKRAIFITLRGFYVYIYIFITGVCAEELKNKAAKGECVACGRAREKWDICGARLDPDLRSNKLLHNAPAHRVCTHKSMYMRCVCAWLYAGKIIIYRNLEALGFGIRLLEYYYYR